MRIVEKWQVWTETIEGCVIMSFCKQAPLKFISLLNKRTRIGLRGCCLIAYLFVLKGFSATETQLVSLTIHVFVL